MTMKLRLGVAVLAASLACGSAHATTFTALYAFGDSLSDAGNLTILHGFDPSIPIPPSPPYSPGHFSNGPTWVEDLSVALGLGTLTPSLAGGNDYAFGGATTGSSLPIDLSNQVFSFTASVAHPVKGALYTLDIGANDILNALSNPASLPGVVSAAISAAIAAVTALYTDGARNLLFYDVPQLSLTPDLNSDSALIKTAADTAAQAFNAGVLAGLTTLEGEGLKVYNLDTYDLLGDIVSNPSSFHFGNVTDACVSTACVGGTFDQQNEYLFWDGVHPTAEGHMVTANFAIAALGGVPEPSTWAMMLIGFAGLGFAGYLKRRPRAA
jgi:phospholipase/lecithinase/hemolysin